MTHRRKQECRSIDHFYQFKNAKLLFRIQLLYRHFDYPAFPNGWVI
jgi:hypothetical protein